MVARRRKFGKKTYTGHSVYQDYYLARRMAQAHRKEGRLARVVKERDGWRVYTRKKP